MFDIGFQELIIIFLVALLVFGPNRLPEVGRTLAKWVLEIRKGIHSAKLQMESEFEETGIKPQDDIGSYIPKELKTDNASTDNESEENKPDEVAGKEDILGKS